MDSQRFDALTRYVGKGLSRRRLLAGLGAAITGAHGADGSGLAATCRDPGRTCSTDAHCCSGLCGPRDATGRRRCHCQTVADCPAPDQCHDATCIAGICGTTVLVGQTCDDGNACTSDTTCQSSGSCGGGAAVTCTPQSQCHSASCDPRTGCVQTVLTGQSCDDGDACTTDDVCQADGSCAGTPVTCTVTEPRCQTAACNPATGKCETTNLPPGTSCADDDRCDGDEACDSNGVCASGIPVSCAHLDTACTTGVCDPATGTCAAVNKADGTSCNDTFAGICCHGLCSECCNNDTSTCGPAPESNMDVACAAEQPNAASLCTYTCLTPTISICYHPVITAGSSSTCLNDAQQEVPCLLCRLPVPSPCTDDSQCCGLCVDGNCEDGLEGSYCIDNADCFSGLCDRNVSACVPPLTLGSACDPANDFCAVGTTCGEIIFLPDESHCCLPIDAACTVDEDCCQNGGVQERCVLGHCQTRGQAGAACGKDFDCFGPLTCVNGTCGSRSELGGACDSDGDCLFDQTTNTQPVCSGGTCKLPNGAACTSGGQCAIGTCVECSYGHVCGNCCTRNESGIDEVFCGDAQSLKICCNNQCVRSYERTHCGTCNYDCTCGGADPLRYCGYEDYGAEFEVDRYRFYCDGYYDLASGHCDTTSGDICSSPPNCDEDCDCQLLSEPGGVSLDCWGQCVGQAENIVVPGFCAKDGNECLDGDDSTCCTDTSLCVEDTNCSSGAIFCLSSKYICVAGT